MSETIAEGNIRRAGSLGATTDYLRSQLVQAGYAVAQKSHAVEGHEVTNLDAELIGSGGAAGTIVVGARSGSCS
ncbi:MAG TPA: hypothetical protein VIX37_15625 [Candidatus Sulfotelmatobacter sp.]